MNVAILRALLVSADAEDLQRLRLALDRAATTRLVIERADSRAEAVPRLLEERWDAVLLDIGDGGIPELEGIARLHDLVPDVPIVVLTSTHDDAVALDALKAGAQDSLPKHDLDGQLLVRAVRYAVERHQLQVALRAMSLVDDLTGLYNRRGLMALARQQLRMADRLNKRLSLTFVDVDDLKVVNDTFGHSEGDALLIEVAHLLRETFRDSDIIARIGGDEFVVLTMEAASTTHPTAWTSRLREHLQERNSRPNRFPLQFSTGVAFYDPEFPTTIEALLARADQLMYQEKRLKRPGRRGRPAPWVEQEMEPEQKIKRVD